jgi:SAM-dependent methyltransferase
VFEKQYVPHPPGYVRRDGKPPRGPGLPLSDVWNATAIESELSGADSLDSIQIKSFSTEKTGYATQKNESLVERIVRSSSREGDLVADFFCGSGTTLAVARRLGRRVLGADVGRAAIALARKRVWAAAPDVPLAVWSLRSWALGRREPAAVEELAARAPDGAVVVDDEVTEPPSRPARGRGHTAAWGFELPAQIQSVAENGVVVGGVAERGAPGLWIGYPALLDPRTRSDPDAVTSWPRLRVRVDIDDRAVQVTVVGIDDPDAPAELTALNPSPRDLIDAWAVDWAGGEVLRADAVHARTHQRRALPDTAGPHRLTGDGPWTITVRAWDVLHREATLRITLARARAPGLARGQIRVTQARMS